MSNSMKISKDREAGAAYISLRNTGTVDKTVSLSPTVTIDYDKHGTVLGIEVLSVDKIELG